MKIDKWLLLFIGLILAIILAACQPAKSTVHTPIETTASSSTSQLYPAPNQPSSQNAESTSYPEPPANAQATTISWSDAQAMVTSLQIAKVIQSKSLEVTLYTKDARIFKTTEPALDDIIKVIQQCGADCKVIKVVNQ